MKPVSDQPVSESCSCPQSSGSTRVLRPRSLIKSPSRQIFSVLLGSLRGSTRRYWADLLVHPTFVLLLLLIKFKTVPKKCSLHRHSPIPLNHSLFHSPFLLTTAAKMLSILQPFFYSFTYACVYLINKQVHTYVLFCNLLFSLAMGLGEFCILVHID